MIDNNQGDTKCSEKKKEGDDGLRTVECLRGRLLAERHASRVAKEDAELLCKKLVELENQLKEEAKLRRRAEKRLKFLMKKLESLKGSSNLEESEQSGSSEISAVSCVSSTDLDSDNAEKTTANQINGNPSFEKNPSPATLCKASDTSIKSSNSSSTISLNNSTAEMGTDGSNLSDDDDYVDNALAMVPVHLPVETKRSTPDLKIVNESVREALDVLRHARQRIQSTLERRKHMVRIGTPQIHSF